MIYDDEGWELSPRCQVRQNKQMTKNRLERLIKERDDLEVQIKQVVMDYKGVDDALIPYKKIIRTEFGLVI
jgi:uncharacterized protein (UPF0335 family)